MVQVLAKEREDVDARDQRGVTPLMVGASLHAAPAVDALLQQGAARLGFDRTARTPLDHAFASTPSRRRPPAGVRLPHAEEASRAHGRWDGLGDTDAQR
mmetsp:Transcript_14554/g.29521  ORF Transcript_14554/g.29521 Transcript_14554/m.29521 type:complete len:99 (+) Transcript_14554:2-298(+)